MYTHENLRRDDVRSIAPKKATIAVVCILVTIGLLATVYAVGIYVPSRYHHHPSTSSRGVRVEEGTLERVQVATCSDRCKCTRAGMNQYGRYCGLGYTGCPGTPPCDDLDECCKVHDDCVGLYGKTDCACHRNLTICATCAFHTDPRASWCGLMRHAAENIISDLYYVVPHCYDNNHTDH